MSLADDLDLIFEAFGHNVKVGARPPAFLENELPHFVEACIDLGEARTNLGEARTNLIESRFDLVEARVDFVESHIDLGNGYRPVERRS